MTQEKEEGEKLGRKRRYIRVIAIIWMVVGVLYKVNVKQFLG